jgi:hypothetical protein
MKALKNIAVFVLSLAILNGCDIDAYPEGETVTEDQKKEIIEGTPDRLSADINGLFAGMTLYGAIYDFAGSTRHNDYGIPAISHLLDTSGEDVIGIDGGYNWFRGSMKYTDREPTSNEAYLIWSTFYNLIKSANDILNTVEAETTVDLLKRYRGQAYATRAFCYLNLVQIFQYTYGGHENDPAVPIVTESMSVESLSENPRASVSEVYALVMSDLEEALKLLSGWQRDAKNMYDQNVLYGLRARANLLMRNWQAAAEDAQRAMEGYRPYTLAEVSKPTLNSATAESWIWAILITEDNDVVKSGIINWSSHLCSLTGNGYTTLVAAWKTINDQLWAKISDTDIRKSWWVDEDLSSKLVDGQVVGGEPIADYFGWLPYVNVKFGPYQDIPDNTTNAQDWCLMRAEEMILIRAEALAMSGNIAEAKTVLEDFVRNNRDPEYTVTASTPEAFQDEVWFQRRIELWGEGFSFLDVLRLKKPVERLGSNFPPACLYNLPAESGIFLYRIPEAEVNVNDGISVAQNNPSYPIPVP